MIEHLHIKNFMCFKALEIPTLKRVNLIAGKNNSGKTTLLDAVRILRSDGKHSVINNILFTRNITKKLNGQFAHEALFNRNSNITHLSINDLRVKQKEDKDIFFVNKKNEGSERLRLELRQENPYDELIYVTFNSKFEYLGDLWENVTLTPKEDDVYEILRDTIQPDLIRLDVGREIVRVRLKDTEKPVPLGTLGDGVYRILLIALSLANAQGSILLIDELELGLHYSALEKLWNMIFKYAQKWDIQVFATTHSQDVLRTFHYVADDEKYINDAQYIRLQVNREGKNEAIIFDGERLRESLELQLEIR